MEDGSEGAAGELDGWAQVAISAALASVTVVFCCWCYGRLDDHPRHGPPLVSFHEEAPNSTPISGDARPGQAALDVVARPAESRTVPVGADRAITQPPSRPAAAADGTGSAHAPRQQPHYLAWVRHYNGTRHGMFGDAVDFVEANPGCANNRKTLNGLNLGPESGGSGWTLLHQAAYWQLPRGLLERLAAAGADGLLADWTGLTPLEITAEEEPPALQSRLDWCRIYREVFAIPELAAEEPPALEAAEPPALEAAEPPALEAADAAEVHVDMGTSPAP